MPVYNGERYLAAALDSVADQFCPDIQVIVVDDGSTDRTRSILNDFRQRIPIEVISHGRLGNWVAVTNLALSHAHGKYACLLHHDDLWLDGRIKAMKNLVRDYPTVDLFLQPAWLVDQTGKRLAIWRSPFGSGDKLLEPNTALQHLLVQNSIPIVAPFFRRQAALQVGGLDEDLWHTADWDFWLKLASRGLTFYSSQPLSAFRVHATSLTEVRSANLGDYRRQLELVLDKHLPGWDVAGSVKKAVSKRARFSIEVNVTLASLANRRLTGLMYLISSCIKIGPKNLFHYLKDSRVAERVFSRLRARVGL
jgi:glycosyltransferase involved in cell wall biosynthesis